MSSDSDDDSGLRSIGNDSDNSGDGKHPPEQRLQKRQGGQESSQTASEPAGESTVEPPSAYPATREIPVRRSSSSSQNNTSVEDRNIRGPRRSQSAGGRPTGNRPVQSEQNPMGGGSSHSASLNGMLSNHSIRSRHSAVSVTRTGPRLSWKSDPKSSFCDWRIEIHSMQQAQGGDKPRGVNGADQSQSKKVDVYNVHRNMVGFGPRKSNYLAKAFFRQIEAKNFGPGSNVTKMSLPPNLASAFPMVLDFLYSTKEAKQTLSAERACSVFKLAELLEIPPLQDAMVEFYRKTLSLKNMTDFLAVATRAKADRLLVASRAKIGGLIYEKPELAGLIRPELMLGILEFNHEQVQKLQQQNPEKYSDEMKLTQSRLWSRAACICAIHNEQVITKEIFDRMTSEDCLPAIDPSIAFKLLMLDAKFDSFSTTYTNLQRRCVESITNDWSTFQKGFPSQDVLSEELRKLPSHVLADILMKSMSF